MADKTTLNSTGPSSIDASAVLQPSAADSCVFPTNPRTDGLALDPYFASDAARTVWIKANPACVTPPPWRSDAVAALSDQPPTKLPATPLTPGLPPLCELPTNPNASASITSVDPHFATSGDRDAWIAANPGCVPPPVWQAPGVGAPLPNVTSVPAITSASASPGLPAAAIVGLSLAGLGVVGAIVYAAMPKPRGRSKSRRSSGRRRSSRRSSRR